MKTILTALLVAVVALNIGVAWGISGKPVLDIEQCNHIIRYEDNSMECRITIQDASDEVASDEALRDESNWAVGGREYRPAQAMSGAELQPAEKVTKLQPVKEYR